ncbi:MAG: hypothetical protein ACLFUV_07375 [Methanomassiliicoccales archaeon]
MVILPQDHGFDLLPRIIQEYQAAPRIGGDPAFPRALDHHLILSQLDL